MMYLKTDEETGEITEKLTVFNSETGEEELACKSTTIIGRGSTKSFKIPSSYYEITPTITTKRPPQLKEDLSPTLGAAILYLLPTTVFFSPVLSLIAVVLEIILHIWAHRKNRSLKDPNRYYQSPLHIILKEFCAACREKESKLKITKFQEKRQDKIKKYGFEYVKRIVT